MECIDILWQESRRFCHNLRELCNDILCVFFHAVDHLAGYGVVKVDVQVFMLQSVQDAEFPIDASEPFNDARDNVQLLVGHLEIIHMLCYCHLLSIDCLVGHTGVMGVRLEAPGMEVAL